jgi:cytidyltransferase-like protein
MALNQPQEKILPFTDAPKSLQRLKDSGNTIVQCHGTFDLLHPGHLYHMEEARALGDLLVVTITGEKHVNKGPGRPYFGDELRCKSLTALEFVDYVVVVPHSAAIEAIECVKPDIYCKGHEYKDTATDVTGNIHDDVTTVEKYGGRIEYVGSVVFSSTRFLNNHFDSHPPQVKQFLKEMSDITDPNKFKKLVDGFSALRCLVIGDIIFDRYTSVDVQGLTSKNRILSARRLGEETHPGGALATFRHLREFTPEVKLVSLAGTEGWATQELDHYLLGTENQVLRLEKYTTIIKQRFVEPIAEGHEMSKLFSVNFIEAEHPPKEIQDKIISHIRPLLKNVDLVLVMDFGHGVMGSQVREFIQEEAPYLSLNCQTNSNNYGFNLINRQYQRADSFSLDRAEISLASSRKQMNHVEELRQLQEHFGANYAWLTLGEDATIGLHGKEHTVSCPSLENQITDTIGAGDAFCSLASLAAVRGIDIQTATFMGQIAGALAVKIPGNRDCIEKGRFLKAGMTMLNF